MTFANDYGANQICMDLDNDKVYMCIWILGKYKRNQGILNKRLGI